MNNLEQEEKCKRWYKIVEEQETSGLTLKDFCVKRDINYTHFAYYRSKLRKLNPVSANELAKFNEVKIKAPATKLAPTSEEIKIHFPNGLKCSIPIGISIPELKQLVEVLISC